MKYENPILEVIESKCMDILTVSGDTPSDGVIEDGNQLPDTEW